jgi:acyl-coenzyme A synthetase/AMP-(fatty) acid ligase
VQRAEGSRLNSLVLRSHCAKHLPAAGIPAELRIGDEPLPKTATGKVDRNAVKFPDVSPDVQGRVS